MGKAKRTSDGEKVAKINGKYLIWAAVATVVGGGVFAIITNSKKKDDTTSSFQNITQQKVDTGSINNYSAGRDVKIENNTYNSTLSIDSAKKGPQNKNLQTVIIYKEKPTNIKDTIKIQPRNQIINNAPNQGVQVNEANFYPSPRKRDITDEQKNILLSAFSDKQRMITVSPLGSNPISEDLAVKIFNFLKSEGRTVTKGLFFSTEAIYGIALDTVEYRITVGLLED